MEKLTFKITIDAPREYVWDILWNDATYQEWTSVFAPGSRAESDWNQGSKILFLDGKGEGMVSSIAVKKVPEFMSFRHLGEVHGGVEDKQSAAWSGATEDYRLKSVNGKTELSVEMDITEEFKNYFSEMWPKALEKLKSIIGRNRQEAVISPS